MRTVAMEFNWILVLSLFFALALASPADKIYRTDYVYNKKTDAFYKLRIDATWYEYANNYCKMEGAQLMVPASQEDIIQLHAMLKNYPDIGDLVWVGEDGQKHESAEETPMVTLEPVAVPPVYSYCDVVTRNGEIKATRCYEKRRPFICKVEARYVNYDEQCRVYIEGYRYYSEVGSCYKVPNMSLLWNGAYAECKAQGTHLVILNSQQEVNTIKDFLKTVPKMHIPGLNDYFYAGIRATKSGWKVGTQNREFRTVFNETLEQTGCTDCWSEGEPNNYSIREDCGAIFSTTGKYSNVDCSLRYRYICEKEIHT